MAYLLPLPAKAGKTVAAARFTFVPDHSLDVIRACAFFGGSFNSMRPREVAYVKRGSRPIRAVCHNYYPTLSDPKYWPMTNVAVKKMFTAFKGQKQQNQFTDELNRQLRNGMWYMFQDGYYVNSALLNIQLDASIITAAFNQSYDPQQGPLPCWDAGGRGVEFFMDAKNDTVLNDITLSMEKQYVGVEPTTYMVLYDKINVDGVDKRNVTHVLVRADALAYCRGVKFDGVPYIKVTETAVSEPRGVVIPRLLREKDTSITVSLRNDLEKVLSAELKKAISGAATPSDAHAAVIQASQQVLNKPESVLYHAYENAEPLERFEIDNTSPNRTEDTYLVTYPLNGKLTTKYGLALLKLFGSSRCFVDAVTTLALTAGGNAISGGVAGAFLSALQNSTESEAILIYALSAGEDPMRKYDPEGLVNGSIAVTPSDSADENVWLSDKDIALYSRNAPTRNVRYWLVNQKKREVYSLDYTYNFETGCVTPSAGYAYDDNNKCSLDLQDVTFVSNKSSLNTRKPIVVNDTIYGVKR